MSFADDLLCAGGDVVVIPLALAKRIGLQAAAFLRQAAYLSAIVERKQGWFFLEQEGEGDPAGKTIFQRLGSWRSCLGIGPDAQAAIRKKLGKNGLGLLQETRKGMVHGRILYKVDTQKYLEFLASCTTVNHCLDEQTEKPDCTNGRNGSCADRKSGLRNRQKPTDNNKVVEEVEVLSEIPPPPPETGGDFDTTPTPPPKPSAGTVTDFLRAAGNPEVLVAEVVKLEAAIAGATVEQANMAGLAWLSTELKTCPVGLAVVLCKNAAAGLITPCALAVAEAKGVEKVALENIHK